MFRRNKRRGSAPAASSAPAGGGGSRSQADDDHSRACLAAANCLLYEADGGPDVNVGTDAEPEVISHAEATQRTYAKLLVSDFEEYGGEDIVASVAAPLTLLDAAHRHQIINEVGVDNATYETLDEAGRGFTGPAMLQSGPIECGVPPYISICAREVSVRPVHRRRRGVGPRRVR